MKIAERMDWWLGRWRHVIKYSLAQICYDRDERIEVGGWGSGRDTEMYATQQFYWNTILFKCHSAVLLNSNFIQMQQCSFIEIKSYSNATVQFFFIKFHKDICNGVINVSLSAIHIPLKCSALQCGWHESRSSFLCSCH